MSGLTHIGEPVAAVRDQLSRSIRFEALGTVGVVAASLTHAATVARAHLKNGNHARAAAEIAKVRAVIAVLAEIDKQLEDTTCD